MITVAVVVAAAGTAVGGDCRKILGIEHILHHASTSNQRSGFQSVFGILGERWKLSLQGAIEGRVRKMENMPKSNQTFHHQSAVDCCCCEGQEASRGQKHIPKARTARMHAKNTKSLFSSSSSTYVPPAPGDRPSRWPATCRPEGGDRTATTTTFPRPRPPAEIVPESPALPPVSPSCPSIYLYICAFLCSEFLSFSIARVARKTKRKSTRVTEPERTKNQSGGEA
jgi:hypothetical protein